MLWWRKGRFSGNSPLACSTAILAQMPVPQGQRSIAPVQVAGSSQEKSPEAMVTAFFQSAFGSPVGPESCEMVMPTPG